MQRLIDRFESKINKTESCWLWLAGSHERGYGFFYTGKHESGKKMEYAHRVAYKLYNGPLEDNECVCHKCDNPRCVNPKHLFKGSHADNMRDMVIKKRNKSGRQKLTYQDYEFAKLMKESGFMVKDIAEFFNIDTGHASRISR